MNYADSNLYITNKHEGARKFSASADAEQVSNDLNLGRPEGFKPFRVEICGDCVCYHVRRGRDMYVKAEP